MSHMIGQFIGGLFAVFIFSALVEWALIKRIMSDPISGSLISTAIAYLLAVGLYGFGSANGGPWTGAGVVPYLPGACVVGFLRYRKAVRNLETEE